MNTLYRYLRDYWVLVLVALFLAAINQVFSMLDPAILQRIIDRYASHVKDFTATQFIRGVGGLLGLSVGAAFVSRVAKNFQDYYVNVITQQVGARIYSDGIRHSLELPYADFEDQRSGETLGRLQKVRIDVEKLINIGVSLFFTTIIGVIFVMVYSATKYWAVGPAYLLTIPMLGALSSLLSKKIKTVQQVIVKETTALAGSTTESLRNIELVKSLGLAQQEIGRLNATTSKILKLELKKVRYLRSLSFVQGTFVNLLRTSIQFLMMYLIFRHRLTIGDYMALFIYSFFIFGPLQELGNVVNTYREAEVSLQNFEAILAMKPEPRPDNPIPVSELDTLEFRDVGFQHNTASQAALQHISFSVTRGKTIAFVGPSGAGKTTLVKLLVGLYRPRTGHIHYNGIPEDEVAIDSLRGRIGFVTQDAQLFSGSIRENLLFVQPDATDEECLDVLRQASVQTLLARADNGLDTVIGEGGVKVSGGEKQRLSIARALLRKPQLLVFDEATSSLDSLTEEEISHTIRTVADSRDAITILIAHRLSTVMHADCIYVLERGRIVESGRHEELVERKGLYYAMWRQQVGENTPALPVRPSTVAVSGAVGS
jgi:ATP-binding cassette subfamily B protein